MDALAGAEDGEGDVEEELAQWEGDQADDGLVGKLVEIRGSKGGQAWVSLVPEDGEEPEPCNKDMNGEKGQCVGWSDESEGYIVHTFDGLTVSVPEEDLIEFEAFPAEDGGFDMVWPQDLDPEEDNSPFGEMLAETLQSKGYCVVQLSLSSSTRGDAASAARSLEIWDRVREETEVDYLGRDNKTKVKALKRDDPEEAPEDALGFCDRYLTELGQLLSPQAPEVFGYELIGRTPSFARIAYEGQDDEARSRPPPFSGEEVDAGRVEDFLQFVRSRKLCALLFLEGGGEVTLYPKPDSGLKDVTLSLSGNRLVVFRQDMMGYSYVAESTSTLVLQAWVIGPVPSIELDKVVGCQKDFAEMLEITGPWQPEGAQGLVKSLMVRMPGRSWGYRNYWNMFIGGTDCVLEWGTRWETEPYYEVDKDMAMLTGKSYMHHGGFLDEKEFTCFDNDFFEYSWEESMCMYPGQRICLEVGYEALHRAGYSRKSSMGEQIAVQLGDVGPDWHSVREMWPAAMIPQGVGDYVQRHLGAEPGITCTRLSHFLNLVGPTNTVATACSSSLVALNLAHHTMANKRDYSEATKTDVYQRALVIGINTLMGPMSFMGQCTTGGTSYKGRCHTFDGGADGYQRGEGCSATFMQMSDYDAANTDRLACVIGSAVNQDGRSASLTAPNGPAQSMLIRAAMKMGGLKTVEVTAAECHGTGTALGDPIEIGAQQNVLGKRDEAILTTSAKSNMAHLEASAGMAGFAKCIQMILNCTTPPNQHLRNLNPHLTVEGYPVYFTTEATPWGQNSGYCGVSSFGMGGTNARGEVLGRAQQGPECTKEFGQDIKLDKVDFVLVPCPRCFGPMGWLDGSAVPKPITRLPTDRVKGGEKSETEELATVGKSDIQLLGKQRMSLIRDDDFADYSLCSDCYQDLSGNEFRYGNLMGGVPNPSATVYIKGTWNGYTDMLPMEELEPGCYAFFFALGVTRSERFELYLERDPTCAIYPVKDNARSVLRIQGPDAEGNGHGWLIQPGDAAAGIIFKIVLRWEGDRKRISWGPLDEDDEDKMPEQDDMEFPGRAFKHGYSIKGSWATGKVAGEMVRNEEASTDSVDVYTTSFKIGPFGREDFYFLRDNDDRQMIYPATHMIAASSVDRKRDAYYTGAKGKDPATIIGHYTADYAPVRGPDALGEGKCWQVRGQPSESVMVTLKVSDLSMEVSVNSQAMGSRSWVSEADLQRQKAYYLSGTFNDWGLSSLEPLEGEPGRFSYRLEVPASYEEEQLGTEFQVVVDADPLLTMYPQIPAATSGEGIPEGPGVEPLGHMRRCWNLEGRPGALYDIVLDMSVEDRRLAVTWTMAEEDYYY